MRKGHVRPLIPGLVLYLSVLACLAAQATPGQQATLAASETPSGASPTVREGEWTADAEPLGEITLAVSADGDMIAVRAFHFTDFACGGVTADGTASPFEINEGEISDNQFELRTSAGPFEITIRGSFDAESQTARGTWQAVFQGASCDGEWSSP
jgi:hypothetical protein